MKIGKKLIAGAMLSLGAAFSFSEVQAQTCVVPPSCEELGYTMTEADCGDAVKFLKCPLDQSKMFCLNLDEIEGDTVAHVGDIMYSDKTFSTELIKSKIPIGVVFDDANHLAVALDQTSGGWSDVSGNIPTLSDCNADYDCSANGRDNTAAIFDYIQSSGKIGKYRAVEYCINYKPSTVYQDDIWYAQGEWFLPSVKELNILYQNKTVVNETLEKINAPLVSSTYWASNEDSSGDAWVLSMSNGETEALGKVIYGREIRPILAF